MLIRKHINIYASYHRNVASNIICWLDEFIGGINNFIYFVCWLVLFAEFGSWWFRNICCEIFPLDLINDNVTWKTINKVFWTLSCNLKILILEISWQMTCRSWYICWDRNKRRICLIFYRKQCLISDSIKSF